MGVVNPQTHFVSLKKIKKDGCCVFTVTIKKPKKKPFHSRLAISVNHPVCLESSEWFNICESKCARHLKVSSACKAGANVQAKKHQFFANLTCALFIWIAWGFTSLRAVLWLSIWRLETDRIQQQAQKGNDTNDEHHFRSIGWGTMTLELFLTPNAEGRIRRFWLLTVEVQTGRVFFRSKEASARSSRSSVSQPNLLLGRIVCVDLHQENGKM